MQELQQETFKKRQIAHKVKISDILNSNYLYGSNVSRVNIIATLVYKSEHNTSYTSSLIDDGSGKISLRSFEDIEIFSKVDVGDVVLVIGKVREFNNEKYVVPEILKKINNFEWVNVRKAELKVNNNVIVKDITKIKDESTMGEVTQDNNEEIYLLIKKLDDGSGVSIEEIIKISKNSNSEYIINKLLENGDIFEINPGKLKVLE